MERSTEENKDAAGSSSGIHTDENSRRRKRDQSNHMPKEREESKQQIKVARLGDSSSTELQPELKTQTIGTLNTPNEDLEVAITTNNMTELTSQEYDVIIDKIDKMIQEAACSNGVIPEFKDITHTNGAMSITCLNEDSRKWLQEKISLIKGNIPQAKLQLKVIQQKDIIKRIKRFFTLKQNKFHNKELTILKNQNPWADVEKWSQLDITKRGDYIDVVVGVPSDILPKIYERDSLKFGLNKVKLQVFNKEEGEIEEIEPATEIDESATSAVPTEFETNGNEAGQSGNQRQRSSFRENHIDKRRESSRDQNAGEVSEPTIREPTRHDSTRQSRDQPSCQETPPRLPDAVKQVDELNSFMLYKYAKNNKDSFPEFVAKKCKMAEKLIGTRMTEQHLVIATILSLPYNRIKDELLTQPPKTLQELRMQLGDYTWCSFCAKIGHTNNYCWNR